MTRSDLIARINERFPLLLMKDVEISVREILAQLSRTIVAGERIEIRQFGSFGVTYRPPRVRRNPKSGEKVMVPGKYIPYFRVGKELKARLASMTD